MQEIEKKKNEKADPLSTPRKRMSCILFVGVGSLVLGYLAIFNVSAFIACAPIVERHANQLLHSKNNDVVSEVVEGISHIVISGNHSREVKDFATMLRGQGYRVVMVSPHYRETAYSLRGRDGGTFYSQIEVITHLSALAQKGKAEQ